MKHMLSLSALSALMLLFSCSKSKNPDINETLIGKWKITASAISSGGPLKEYPVEEGKQSVIAFKRDSSYTSSVEDNRYTKFTLGDNNRLTLTGPVDTAFLAYAISGNTRKILPVNPMCIEVCYTKYVAVP